MQSIKKQPKKEHARQTVMQDKQNAIIQEHSKEKQFRSRYKMNALKRKRLLVHFQKLLLLSSAHAMQLIMNERRKKAQRRHRRYAVRPMNRRRAENGHFYTLTKDMLTLEADREQFIKYTRCSPMIFVKLLQLVGPHLQKDVNKNPYILSPAHRLTLTLCYLAEGCSMQEIARSFRIGKTTAHIIIKETCRVLWNVLPAIVMKPPTSDSWKKISNEFFQRWNMPNCIGAIDGKHIMILAPPNSGSKYFNHKKSFSIVLMAVCDAFYRFIAVDIGAAGSNHDSIVFRDSDFGKLLFSDHLDIPGQRNLPHTSTGMNNFLVASHAFPLHKHIMRPYPGCNLGEKKNVFNYRLSRARRAIENAFDILVERWRILRKKIIAGKETCEEIVMACLVLHNFVLTSELDLDPSERQYIPTGYQEISYDNGVLHINVRNGETPVLQSVGRLGSNNPAQSVKEARDKLADYFVSAEGSLPWQLEQGEEIYHKSRNKNKRNLTSLSAAVALPN